MNRNVINAAPYLQTTRQFPFDDPMDLSVEINKSYVDIANAVNERIIGIFPLSKPAINGESWFFTSRKQQALRQIYTFTTTANLAHGIPRKNIYSFSKCTGVYTDNINWYGLPFASNVAIPGQITFYLTDTNIVFLTGAGAPTLTNGFIVLEWIAQT